MYCIKIHLFLFIVFLSKSNCELFAQEVYYLDKNYTENSDKIDSFVKNKNLVKATVLSNNFYSKCKTVLPFHLFRSAELNAIFANNEKAYYFLERLASDKNFVYYDKVESAPAFVKMSSNERFREIVGKIRNNWNKYIDTFEKKEIANELFEIYNADQRKRVQYLFYESTLDSFINKEEFEKEIVRQDRINQVRILKLIEKNGWLFENQVGLSNEAYFSVFQHAENDFQKKYFNIIEKAYKEGNVKPSNFAIFEDRLLVNAGKKQKYGSQLKNYKKEWVLYPTENIDSINSIRAKMDLEPIENYLEFFNIKWSLEGYKIKEKELCDYYKIVD
jgi:hypothetical protein